MTRRHCKTFDLTHVTNEEHRAILQDALNACSYPMGRIRKNTGKTVPVWVSDLARWNASVSTAHEGTTHDHSHGVHSLDDARRGTLGLYWLPTIEAPAGRIEVSIDAMKEPDLAREVFLAESAHAVDYGALTEEQRGVIGGLFDHVDPDTDPHPGWFEEKGEENYWAWRGERWMGLFMATYASRLPRVLEPEQPWLWTYDRKDIAKVRKLLR